jgi:hypothetical protein
MPRTSPEIPGSLGTTSPRKPHSSRVRASSLRARRVGRLTRSGEYRNPGLHVLLKLLRYPFGLSHQVDTERVELVASIQGYNGNMSAAFDGEAFGLGSHSVGGERSA